MLIARVFMRSTARVSPSPPTPVSPHRHRLPRIQLPIALEHRVWTHERETTQGETEAHFFEMCSAMSATLYARTMDSLRPGMASQ